MAKLERLRISRSGLTPAKRLYLEYWTAFRDLLEQRNGVIKPRKPYSQPWMSFAVGRSNFHLHAWASVRGEWIRVDLMTDGEHGKPHFHLLKKDRVEIEKEIGAELVWKENPVERYISLYQRGTDLEDRQDWNRQHRWLYEQLETFHKVFSPRVRALDASDYLPEEDETTE